MRKSSNYQDSLRAIGHEIDLHKLRAFAIEEDGEAIWVLALRKTGGKRHMRWQYREHELLNLVVRARARRGTGYTIERHHNYEDTLRLIGRELDRRSCQSFSLVECNGDIMVRYSMAPSVNRPYLLAFSQYDLKRMVDETMVERAKSAPRVAGESQVGRCYETWVVGPTGGWGVSQTAVVHTPVDRGSHLNGRLDALDVADLRSDR